MAIKTQKDHGKDPVIYSSPVNHMRKTVYDSCDSVYNKDLRPVILLGKIRLESCDPVPVKTSYSV